MFKKQKPASADLHRSRKSWSGAESARLRMWLSQDAGQRRSLGKFALVVRNLGCARRGERRPSKHCDVWIFRTTSVAFEAIETASLARVFGLCGE